MTIRGYDKAGYGICVNSAESWVVAINNAGPNSNPKQVKSLGAHPNTDETFILVKGSACIVTAPQNEPENFSVISMEHGVCYNVHRNTWHTVFMSPGAKVAICENRNPSTEQHILSEEARSRLEHEAMEILITI